MMYRNCVPDCDPCRKDCHKGCNPAQFGCDFDVQVSPYDPSQWFVTICGATKKIKAPCCPDIDTTLSTNYSNASLNYKAEYHTDTITGEQLGDIINLDDLRNTNIDQSLDGYCYELIYRKWAECGEGCYSATDSWANFNINTEDALQNGIQYVRGANQFGCPVYLDQPTDTTEYWWGMWRPNDTGNGLQFGYIQPEPVDELPTDDDGNIVVISQKPNGQPVVGSIAANFCANAVEFTCRNASPQVNTYFTPNSTTFQEFNVVPDDNPDWRAPCCGVMWVGYCVNPINQDAGVGEIDVTVMLDNETWSSTLESQNSSHSTWTWTQNNTDCSESVSAMRVVPAGRTIKLHARNTGDVPSQGMSVRNGQWRVHAVRSVFIPLTLGA